MRVKVSAQNVHTKERENYLISVPKHLKYIVDLQVHIIEKLNISDSLDSNNNSISLSVDGYHLPSNEKIAELIQEDDLINLEFVGHKRKSGQYIENIYENEAEERVTDGHFMKLIQEVSALRNLYSGIAKKRIIDSTDRAKGINSCEQTLISPEPIIIQKEYREPTSKSKIQLQAPKNGVSGSLVQANKAKQTQKAQPKKIVKPESETSESSSDQEETTIVSSKKQTLNKKAPQEKTLVSKNNTVKKVAEKKKSVIAQESDSSSEEEEEEVHYEPIKEKKMMTTLNIPTPLDEFNKKKQEWDKLPIAQWKAGSNNKKTENSKDRNTPKVDQKVVVNPVKKQDFVKPQTTDVPVQKSEPVKVLNTEAIEAKPKQQFVPELKQNFVRPINHTQDKQKPLFSYNSAAKNYAYMPEQEDKEIFKPRIYEPNVLNSALNQQVQQSKTPLKGYVQLSISKMIQKYKNDKIMILQVGDYVKYKCECFSVKLMTPVLSDWRDGSIIELQNDRLIIKRNLPIKNRNKRLEEDDEDEEEELEEDELFFHNLRELHISESSLDAKRKAMINNELKDDTQPDNDIKIIAEKKRKLEEELRRKLEESEQEAETQNPVDLKKRMVGKQINFYFSDKAYAKDKFIQAHTAKDPEKYMPISLLLNFPKLKNMTSEQSVIVDSIKNVIATDPKCFIEIDSTESKIRKKGICK